MAQGNFLQSLFNRQPQMQPMIRPEDLPAYQAEQAKITAQRAQPTLMNGLRNFIQDPTSALFGKQSPAQEQPIIGIDMTQQDYNNLAQQGLAPQISMGAAQNPRTGGLLNDISSGFSENASTPFAVSNLEPQKDKNFATKLGEGLGTAGRFAASPAGRGLITAGLVGLGGGSGLQALTYGTTAGVKNQGLRTEDQFYRNQLQGEGVDTSDIQGNVTPEMYKNQSLGQYRSGMLDLGGKRLSLTDYNNVVKNLTKMHTNNEIDANEFKTRLELVNKKFENDNIAGLLEVGKVGKSNQTRNADVSQYLAPAKKRMYESAPAIAGARLGLQQAEFGLEAPYKQAQTAKIQSELYKPYAEKQLKTQETLNNIDYAENLIGKNKNLVGVYSPLTAQAGRLTGGTLGMSKADLANRGEIARTVGTIKNDLLSQARNSGQTGINTMAEINQATAGLDENSSAEELQGALKSMRRIANRTMKQTPSNISPFMPNANLTPIPQSAFGGGQVRPRQTSKPKATPKSKGGMDF